ncbi:MAG: hypothetical protein PW735_03710 [Acidobacteriaceae bacterium]|nr:hypothetical protein [Acidobacteriaceae bacterium]
MDKVRFGRALGKGARAAAKSLAEAADAATSPDPRASARRAAPHPTPYAQAAEQLRQTQAKTARAGKQVGKGVLAPVKKFSTVVTLQVVGVFFALFALTLGRAVWQQRAAFAAAANAEERHKLWLYLLFFVLFSYFSLSSFLRARRRDRRA